LQEYGIAQVWVPIKSAVTVLNLLKEISPLHEQLKVVQTSTKNYMLSDRQGDSCHSYVNIWGGRGLLVL
jgi:hypothetical protein